MNEKAKSIVKNLYYTVAANFATLAISVLLNLFVPKLLGVKEYSYWQLYVFYSSYVGFLHLGWVDGIYLKIGGAEYEDLDKRKFGSQFWYLNFFEVIISTFVILVSFFLTAGSDKKIILIMTAIVSVVTIAKTFILYIFQSTNRIKEYAQLSRGDRYIYAVSVLVYLLLGWRSFFWLIVLDILSKLIMTIWGMYHIRDMVRIHLIGLKKMLPEILDNINIGSKLMLSNVASMLIIGIIRFFVDQQWSVVTFGKLSLTLSISNMFLTFVNAVGVVMFPLLRRTNQDKLPQLYMVLRSLFVPITYSFLIFYIPIKFILSMWLPAYADSLMYMGILFPMVVYEGRMSLLVNTYLKTIRKEKTILFVNVMTLVVTFVSSLIVIFLIKNLLLAVGLIIFSLAFRCNLAEIFLSKYLNVKIANRLIIENLLTIGFILSNIIFSQWISLFVYIVLYLVFLIINAGSIKKSFITFKGLVTNH